MLQVTPLHSRAATFIAAALLTACSSPTTTQTTSFVASGQTDAISSQQWHVTSLVKAPHPRAVAVSSSFDVYFTEEHAAGVKMLKPTGNVQNLGGDLKLPWGVAAYKSRVYVADSGNDLVKEIMRGGKTKQLGSGWVYPFAVAVDTAGDLYVLDPEAQKITRITPKGSTSTVPTPQSCGEGSVGLGVDAQQNMYVSCVNEVFQIQPNGVATPICSHWNHSTALATDSVGDTFVVGFGNKGHSGAIYECTASQQLLQIKPDSYIGEIDGLAVDASGNLYAATQKFEIYKLTPPSPQPI